MNPSHLWVIAVQIPFKADSNKGDKKRLNEFIERVMQTDWNGSVKMLQLVSEKTTVCVITAIRRKKEKKGRDRAGKEREWITEEAGSCYRSWWEEGRMTVGLWFSVCLWPCEKQPRNSNHSWSQCRPCVCSTRPALQIHGSINVSTQSQINLYLFFFMMCSNGLRKSFWNLKLASSPFSKNFMDSCLRESTAKMATSSLVLQPTCTDKKHISVTSQAFLE